MFRALNRRPLSMQILITIGVLLIVAFTVTAISVYVTASNAIQQSVTTSQTNQIKALATTLEGRYDAEKTLVFELTSLFLSNNFRQTRLLRATEKVGAREVPIMFNASGRVSSTRQTINQFHESTGNHITIFVRDGDDLVRIITSLKQQDGNAALGTALTGTAKTKLLSGERYTANLVIFGEHILGNYAPILDFQKEVIGAVFVGLPMARARDNVIDDLSQLRWGETGGTIIVDASDEAPGHIIYAPPDSEFTGDIRQLTAENGQRPFATALKQPSGLARYTPLDDKGKGEKAIAYAHVAGWDWMLAGGTYLNEVTQVTRVVVRNIVIIAVAACLIIFLIISWRLRSTLSPLRELSHQVESFGNGNITQKITRFEDDTNNEIHHLAHSVAKMGTQLRSMVEQLQQTGQNLSLTANELNASSLQSQKDSQVMAQHTNQQATAIEEMATSAAQVAEQAEHIADNVRQASTASTNGNTRVDSMIGEIDHLSRLLENSSAAINRVKDNSESISSVTSMIDAIAEQTNLLALNAAIEAARAGEQGRGFAVVADEVRTLAHRTQQSVKQVVDIIEQLQSSTTDAVAHMDNSKQKGEQVAAHAHETGTALAGITTQVEDIATMSDSIAATAEQQAQVAQELASEVHEIKELSEKSIVVATTNVDNAEQVQGAVHSMNDQLAYFK